MAQKTLTTSYLAQLTNANHDGVTQQIDDCLQGFEAEARKTLNMVQQWQAATQYTLQELGIAPWVTKAQQQAQKVLQLVTVRVDNESAKVKGEQANSYISQFPKES